MRRSPLPGANVVCPPHQLDRLHPCGLNHDHLGPAGCLEDFVRQGMATSMSGAIVVVWSQRAKGGGAGPFDVVILQRSRRAVLVVRIGDW
jgi:hypothetical protein